MPAGAAVRAAARLTFGRIGGRPMGMYTAVADTDQWIAQFGVDVEEIDQWELVRRSSSVSASRVAPAPTGSRRRSAGVHYDGDQLTRELLERQIRVYYAMRELIDEWHLDFSGIKGQPELTNHFCTMDVAEAFLNDPYDWDGPKDTHVCATEADMDGALTMQILKLLYRHAGAVRRRPPLPRRPRHLGPVQLRASTRPGSRRAATTRPRTWPGCTSTPRCSTSRPAARRCTTSPHPAR